MTEPDKLPFQNSADKSVTHLATRLTTTVMLYLQQIRVSSVTVDNTCD